MDLQHNEELSELEKSREDFNNKKELKRNILDFYTSYKSNLLKVESMDPDQYSRKKLTGKMAEYLNEMYK